MFKKSLHIFILCLFVVSTVAAPAYAACQCNMPTKEDGMNMPCHETSGEESNNSDDTDKGCCGDVCACATGCTSATLNVPSADTVTKVFQNKYSISPAESLSSVVHAVPGSPPKQLS